MIILFSNGKKRSLFIGYLLPIIMSSKKPEKPEEKKEQSAMNEIKKIEESIKALSTNLNKLKTIFKPKSSASKK